ncbi:hypothetical protein IMSAGC017_01963 [Thomasclavelia cocleata]|uniref:Uncharacterized protein n=1 Tax=Thomasclavelia cocleata TaxID=69824 RepID=A0A829ZD61_9FIRM|nr:hypothetical protein [Thomasclavelia cocleata]GFI41917.1 hypothetical protein IMSAGC017_01963 [Thomasclavelia cocleata]
MNNGISKIIVIVIGLLFLVSFLFKDSNDEKETVYKNEETEILVDDRYSTEVNIDDVLLFDYANMYYQNYSLKENVLTLYYQETCEKIGDDYVIKVFDYNKELPINVVVGKSEYDEDDDLYYTNYHLRIRLPDNIEKFEIRVSRDNAEYTVNCFMRDFRGD